MEIKEYVEYIKECRKRGFDDWAIKDSLLEKNWPLEEINKAFDSIDKKKGVKEKEVKKEDLKSKKEKYTEENKTSSKEDKYYQNMVDLKKEDSEEEDEENYGSNEEEIYKGKYTKEVYGSSVTLFLDDELRTALQKRAKKNMFNLQEQIEDILRRSVLNLKGKKSLPDEKLDDKLVGIFSRRNTGQKTKKKKVKLVKKKQRKEKRIKRKKERKAKKKKKK